MLTSGDGAQNLEDWFGAMIPVDEPTDQSIEQNDEDGAQCVREEENLLVRWESSSAERASASNEIEEEQRSQTHCGVNLTFGQVLQRVDDNEVG